MSPLRLFRAANHMELNRHLRGGKRGRRACEIRSVAPLCPACARRLPLAIMGVRIVSGTNLPGVLEAQLFFRYCLIRVS